MSLIDKLKNSRKTNVEAGGFTFTIQRPTDMQVANLRGSQLKEGDLLEKFVTGWQGVTELDIIPGGTNVAVDFDTELFMAWVEDKPTLWPILSGAILEAYQLHRATLDDALGKPVAG